MAFLPPSFNHTDLGVINTMTAEVDFNDPNATFTIPLYQNTFVEDVSVVVVTPFSAGSTATLKVGDSAAVNGYLDSADLVLTAAGVTKASGAARANQKGKLYAASDNIKLTFVPNAADTAGQLLIIVKYVYLPDQNSNALVSFQA